MPRKTSTTRTTPTTRKPAATTAVRNSPLPRSASGRAQPTREQIARRAYEIYLSGACGGELADWLQAEGELSAG